MFRLMEFPGQSLSKEKDESVIISLSRKNRYNGYLSKILVLSNNLFCHREIQQYFRDTKHLLPNNTEGNLWIDVDCDRKAHYAWVTHVREVSHLSFNIL